MEFKTVIPSAKHIIIWCTRPVEITVFTQCPRRTAPEHRGSTGREAANLLGTDILLTATVSKVPGEILWQSPSTVEI